MFYFSAVGWISNRDVIRCGVEPSQRQLFLRSLPTFAHHPSPPTPLITKERYISFCFFTHFNNANKESCRISSSCPADLRLYPRSQTMESDPQVLVALAASSIEKIASPAACTSPVHTVLLDHDTLPVLVTSSTAGGIGTIPAAPTFPANNSIADKYKVDGAVLDAFASISITNTASQCVAVALEIDVLQHVAVLTIASKYPIAPDLIAYLNGIWRLMSVISKRCEQLRQQVDLTAPMGVRLPISINAAIEPWKSELVKRVYLYCEGKDMRLLQSRWGNLRPFVLRFEPRQDTLSGDSILQRKLTDGIFALGATYRLLQTLAYAQDLPDAQWRDLSCLMDGTVSDIGTVLDDRSLCEQWSREKGCELLLVPCFLC